MTTKDKEINKQNVGEWLSGYIDGELTQQQRQRVELLCEQSSELRELKEELESLRSRVKSAELSPFGEDKWRENMDDTGVQVSGLIGWALLIAGAVGVGGFVVFQFLLDPSVPGFAKFAMFAFYGGMAALLVSVLRQRLIERKTDKYKDVEI